MLSLVGVLGMLVGLVFLPSFSKEADDEEDFPPREDEEPRRAPEGGLWLIGGPGEDHLVGGDGADRIDGREYGASVSDLIEGGGGADLIFVGEGDVVHGGPEGDTFVLELREPFRAPPTFADYLPDEDHLILNYYTDYPPYLSTLLNPDGIWLYGNGAPVAYFANLRDLPLGSIELSRM